jgi:hypothetical protein
VVAAPALRRAGWIVAVVIAAGVIVPLAFRGQRPEPGLARFEAAGVMLHIAPERIVEVEIAGGDERRRFIRTEAGGWAREGGGGPADLAARLDRGLQLLHVSAPQRVMTREEVGGTPASEFGLEPPRLTVWARGPAIPPFVIHFGGPNPQGLAQYARVDGRNDLVLLSRFVGEAWEQAMAE